MFVNDEFQTAKFSSNNCHSRGPKTRSLQRVTVTLRSCSASAIRQAAHIPHSRHSTHETLQRGRANLLPNLAVGDAAADHPHYPVLNIFQLDIHVRSALVEGQHSLWTICHKTI